MASEVGLVLRTPMSTNPTLLTMSKLLSVVALVQAFSIPCLKRCNHLATPLPMPITHTLLSNPHLSYSDPSTTLSTHRSNRVSLTTWSGQLFPGTNSSAWCSSSSKSPTILPPPSALYIHSPLLFFQQTTCFHLPWFRLFVECHPLFLCLEHLFILQGPCGISPFTELFLNFTHSPQQMSGSLVVPFLALSTRYYS